MIFHRTSELPEGSFVSTIYPTEKDKRQKTNGIPVRVIEYTLEGVNDAEAFYRLITTILDYKQAPAQELAALYHERWEMETALPELKVRMPGSKIMLRSKKPDLLIQEFYEMIMAHFVMRGLMHEAALCADEDPDRLSFIHAVRVVRRKLTLAVAFPPENPVAFHNSVLDEILEERAGSSCGRRNPRGVKRKMSNYPLRPRGTLSSVRIHLASHVRILDKTQWDAPVQAPSSATAPLQLPQPDPLTEPYWG